MDSLRLFGLLAVGNEIEMLGILPWIAGGLCVFCGMVAVILRPKTLASWLFCAGMVMLGVERLMDYQSALAAGSAEIDYWLRSSLLVKSLVPGVWLGFSLVYARGNPSEVLSRWKWVFLAAMLIPAGLVLGFPERISEVVESVMGVSFRLLPAGKVWVITVLLVTLAILVNFENTFRASVGMTRWRIKYLILGAALIFGVRLYSLSQKLLFSAYDPELANLMVVAVILGCGLIVVGQVRSSFGEFDIYPSRAVLQGSVTLILAGGYFLIVGLMAQWVALLGGDASFPAQALVLLLGAIGITVLSLSERFRTALRRIISRHFRRPEHDFRKIWTEFTRRTSSVLDAATLGIHAAEVIAESFHVLGVTVFRTISSDPPELEWLHSTEKRRSISGLRIDPESLTKLAKPVDLEREHEVWAEALRQCCPKQFDHGGDRWVVPLVAAERLVGLVVLTDRVNGVPYSHEELDLLKCIGDQLAGALLNCSLTDEVLQAKELEAFQTLSSFFVHDLKNAANSLSLMLQNLPVHFDDPAFRADAVRGVGRTVERINQLILKLGSLRHELDLHVEPCRMDLLCGEVLDGMEAGMGEQEQLVRDLQPVPEQTLDREAMRSVVTNLVSNAHEALGGRGTVTVATRLENGRVAITVADDGSGMTPEFVKALLFRPFHSTKSKGLGIGMFQCKKILEAHGGSISVESEPGNGSRFTILLPLGKNPSLTTNLPHETQGSDH